MKFEANTYLITTNLITESEIQTFVAIFGINMKNALE